MDMKTILVIDDNPLMRMSIRYDLERSGYSVLEAGNGRQALGLFRISPVDIAVVDIFMPEMDGIETILEIKKIAPGCGIIAISKGSEGMGVNMLYHAETLGAQQVLAKPFGSEQLLSAVRFVEDICQNRIAL